MTTEAYPYGAGMTEITSAMFDEWKTWSDARIAQHQLVSTGERLTRKTFGEARARRDINPAVIIHGRTEEQALSLMGAIRKMTLMPAQRLEARVPAMAQKGRVKLGADADLAIFDPATVIDRSTYEDATVPSAGSRLFLLAGRSLSIVAR